MFDFGENLKEIRTSKNLTQKQLAILINSDMNQAKENRILMQ